MSEVSSLEEYGFWEYTCPRGGGCCYYNLGDWERLLDDMAGGGMNSLALVIKWSTTGYRSRLPWLDQDPDCQIIASDNQLLFQALEMAQQRDIRVWMVGVCTHHQIKEFGMVPPDGRQEGSFWYDPDYPGVLERMVALFEEMAELLPATHGLVVEMESVEWDWPHRIPLYNAWAKEHDRPCYEEIKLLPLDARAYRIHAWRDFLTERRVRAYQAIEEGVRATGYPGKLATICETCSEPGSYHQVLNLEELKKAIPEWEVVTYDYHRDQNALATVDFCMLQPQAVGFPTYYLGRGVMTYSRELTIPLESSWRRDLADAQEYGVNGLWFYGADTVPGENKICTLEKLQKMGFPDGLSARKRLLEVGREMLQR